MRFAYEIRPSFVLTPRLMQQRVNDKINDYADSPKGKERDELKNELDKLYEKKANYKESRGQSFERLKVLNDSVKRRVRHRSLYVYVRV
jgi:hypothetical protein